VATGGLRLNVPGGSYLQVQGSYTQGAIRYIDHTQLPTGSPARFGVGNSLGLGYAMDAIFGQSGELELTRAWGVYASWEQVWNPKWKTSLYGGYLAFSYDDNAKALIASATCGNQNGSSAVAPGLIVSAGTSPLNAMASGSIANMTNCDPNWQKAFIGTRTQWNITSQFYLGVDVIYTKLYTAFEGLAVLRSANERPSGVYAIENQDNWAVTFRAHRDFVL
jgi:hypothetical protein